MGCRKRLVELFLVVEVTFAVTASNYLPSDVLNVQENREPVIPKLKSRVETNILSDPFEHPLFLTTNYSIVETQIGTTAVLHCEVIELGESTVSWIRRRDYHLLTVGKHTYSSDVRFFTSVGKEGQDWALHIRHAHIKDEGLYECQVTTHPSTSLFVHLQLVEAHADIVGGSEKIVKAGSPLRLSCILRRSTEAPTYVFWYHFDRMINYDLQGGAAVRHGRQGSELVIPKARPTDGGTYSCVPSNARPANVTVHVLQSEKPAAMQHDSKGDSTRPFVTNQIINIIFLCLIWYKMQR